MNLVEAESVGPVEGDAPLVTPPRPPHRRVSVSLLFTLTVLIGTVVTIYMTFPARNNVLVTEAIAQHRVAQTWDLVNPTANEVRAWAIGIAGKDVPLPVAATKIIGARQLEVLNRDAAMMRVEINGIEVTYLIQRARGFAPKTTDRQDGDVHALAWRRGRFTCVAVGPEATLATWRTAFP